MRKYFVVAVLATKSKYFQQHRRRGWQEEEGERVASTARTSGRQCCHGQGQMKGEATSQGSKLFTSVCIGVCVLFVCVSVCVIVSVLFYSYTLRPTICTMCAVAFIRRVLRLVQGLLLSCSSNSIFMSLYGDGDGEGGKERGWLN